MTLPCPRRRGVSPAEVLVIIALVGFLAMLMLVALPRQRENARLAGCKRNLMQIGVALAMYENATGRLPAVPPLDPERSGPGPLRLILESLVVPDLAGLTADGPMPKPMPGSVPGERPVPGFTCPSDPFALASFHVAPISYRACAGDRHDGASGGFAPGSSYRIRDIDEGDGLAYTAAFAERLTGTGRVGIIDPANYALQPPPLPTGGGSTLPASSWQGDAGETWREASWRSTLYNHALPPNARESTIATDSKTASMGASSAHVNGIHVLLFDGSIRVVTRTIAPPVWAALGTARGEAGSTNGPDAATRPGDDATTRGGGARE